MFRSRTDLAACLLLFFLGLFVFSRNLNIHGLEYRDDEIFYFQSAKEMLASGDILSPTYFGEDRFQKPILFYWMVLLAYRLLGVHWAAARSVAVISACLTVCLTWLIAKRFFTRRTATLSALILMTVPLFFRHAKNVVPDMTFNFFIVLALYGAVVFIRDWELDKNKAPAAYGVLFFISCSLGFMVKGFIAFIVPMATVVLFCLLTKRLSALKALRFGCGALVAALVMCPWFIYMIATHGQDYLNYMLVEETKNRLIGAQTGNFTAQIFGTFFRHGLFYIGAIGSYFAPWCIFLFGAIPLAFVKPGSVPVQARDGLILLLAWFFVVFLFSSIMHVVINHYMLVLTTPFAILVSYFFSADLDRRRVFDRMAGILQEYVPVICLTVGVLAFAVLFVFLAGAHRGWLVMFLAGYIAAVRVIQKSSHLSTAPMILGMLILIMFSQSSLLAKSGMTAHSALQKFAGTVNREIGADTSGAIVIGVGSHDIHEKEFQIYFQRRVIKAAGSTSQETRAKLGQLFRPYRRVYCLITEKDFKQFLQYSVDGPFNVIQEDYIVRRRMALDRKFFVALAMLDQSTVRDYLKEKVFLVRKEPHV